MNAPFLGEALLRVAVGLHNQAIGSGDPTLITDGISAWRRVINVVPADYPQRAEMLSSLNQLLRHRFELAGKSADVADLDEAIRLGREAVQAAPVDSVNRGGFLSDLGVALRVRFERTGLQAGIEEAIAVSRTATELSRGIDDDHAGYLSNLGLALWTRFERFGHLADLDEAIAMGREAAQTRHPNQAMFLSNLSNALQLRFEALGSRADLMEAVKVARKVVRVTAFDDPDRASYLSNLGAALRVQFELTNSATDLEEAVTVGVEAVRIASAGDPDRPGFLSNAALALRTRFESVGAPNDLDEAIRLGRAAVSAVIAIHPDHAMLQANLGGLLQLRSTLPDGLAYLDEAITAGRAAVQAIGADHPDLAQYLSNLGAGLRARSARLDSQPDLDEAINVYVRAAHVESAAPSVRARAATVAASLTAQTDPAAAGELLEMAVGLLPRTVPRRLDRGDQQHALGPFAGLASDAAAMALRADETTGKQDTAPSRALRLLELGRGILLSQALDTRTDLTDLETQGGDQGAALAARFRELRELLDQAGDTGALVENRHTATRSGKRRTVDRHNLAAMFDATVNEIRSLGFATFLLPPEAQLLMRQAEYGSVVVVNVSQYRSDAILLRPERITSIPLPKLAKDVLTSQIDSFRQALLCKNQNILSETLEWLWDAVAEPILNELGHRHAPAVEERWPRVWWAPGGLLSLLPLHAAGYHRETNESSGERRSVMDRVISSYTPTVRALGHARERTATSPVAERALIVAMPTTPGLDPLYGALREADMVRNRFAEPTVLIERSASTAELPTRAAVFQHMRHNAVAHFACHGTSDAVDPSRSRLFLHDHDSAPFTVASLAPVSLDHVRLAYLSACRTMFSSSADLIDEAIHLATAFQLAGYPQVVGTLWEISDTVAPRVAELFYTRLATGPTSIDTKHAAEALHYAVRSVRDDSPAIPFQWAAYVHAGA